MKLERPILLVVALLVLGAFFATPAAAFPDIEGDAIDALLGPVDEGARVELDDKALARLLAVPSADPWLLVERLLARNRQDLAIRLARLTDEDAIGPLRAYAEAADAVEGSAKRLRALIAARTALEAGKNEDALRHAAAVRSIPGRVSVYGVFAGTVRGNALTTNVEKTEAWLDAGEEALRIGWWAGSVPLFFTAIEAAMVTRSLDLLDRAMGSLRTLREIRGDVAGLASVEQDLGSISLWRGDLPGALRHLDEALSLYEELGEAEDVAQVRSMRSEVFAELGDFRAALDEQRALAAYFAERPRDEAWADNQFRLGLIRLRLGDEEGASGAYTQALEAFQAGGDRQGEAAALGNIGLAHSLASRWEEALAAFRTALAITTEVRDPMGSTAAKNNIADCLMHMAQVDLIQAAQTTDQAARDALQAKAKAALSEAEALGREAMRSAVDVGAIGLACGAKHTVAEIVLTDGRIDEALTMLESARDEAARLRAWNLEVSLTATLTRARVAKEDWSGALREARRAADQLATSFGGLTDADLARVRRLTPDVFDLGVRAGVRSGRGEEIAYFLEAGRAMALLQGLGGRAAALRATVPAALMARLAQATRAKLAAFVAWKKSRDAGVLRDMRRLRKAYDERREAERKILEQIQQVQTAAADRLAPARPVSPRDMRKMVRSTSRPGLKQVFLIFNFQWDGGVVLVVQKTGARVVGYSSEDVSQLREAFATLGASSKGVLDADALAVVKRLLIDPLEIPAGPTRLFVCPDRGLAYVPLSVILPDDWEVVWEPSATTYDLLTERRLRKGRGVLGLGDPDYRSVPDPGALTTRGGPLLSALPGTRLEIEGITKRTGDRRLLGEKATERGLRKTLEASGGDHLWRSVHFACHGMVDVEYPALSCLAITPGDGEDGFLTSSEVLQLSIRTDLVVLSACQTGRGKYVRGEGLMSLTRAFMYAGAPRVIVSLWDVDDAATSFLMQAFYREWNAGRGTAESLRRAQLAVRDHEIEEPAKEAGKPAIRRRPWSDPRYWGAWVLWGLPN